MTPTMKYGGVYKFRAVLLLVGLRNGGGGGGGGKMKIVNVYLYYISRKFLVCLHGDY